ncbi:MAG: L,D-transpeptidase [Pseudomonadota bacterium]
MFKRRMTALQLAATAVVASVGLSAAPTTADAQFWGGSSSVYGQTTVSFPRRYSRGQIVVSFSDRRLYLITSRGRAISYPIAVPRPQSRWSGVLRVSQKRVNPSWTPTPRMRRENPKLPAFVPGGSKYNPMGTRALYLGSTLYRIHGTDAPWTIGKNVSKGCVRMHNSHVEDLYRRVGVGTRVTATWRRFGARTVASSDFGGSTSGGGGTSVENGTADWARKIHGR